MSGALHVAASVSGAQRACADFVEQLLVDAQRHGRASLALSGGSTPRPTYERLATSSRIDWSRVDVYFADERCVPPEHADSNYRMVHEALTAHVAAKVYRMEGERANRVAAAKAYAALLPPVLDVVILGMGPDGHTASLFPGHAALRSSERVLFIANSPKPPPERLTIGADVIRTARTVVMLVTGNDKSAMLKRARQPATSIDDVPAALAHRGTWFVDEAASQGA